MQIALVEGVVIGRVAAIDLELVKEGVAWWKAKRDRRAQLSQGNSLAPNIQESDVLPAIKLNNQRGVAAEKVGAKQYYYKKKWKY